MRNLPLTRHLLLIAALIPGLVSATENQIAQSAVKQIQLMQLDNASRTPVQRKINSNLLMAARRSSGDALFSALPDLRNGIDIAKSQTIVVDIKANVTEDLLNAIHSTGGTVVNQHPRFQAIRARVSVTDVEYLAGFSEVISIRPADKFMTNKLDTSEGVVAHAADIVHGAYDGTGTQTCVLSDGVDSVAISQASGDLPVTVNVLPGQAGGGDEGTAMLEIVHDMAPGTALWFATAFSGQAQFAQNILDLETNGCDVIVDDVFYFAEPVFQDGVIAQAVSTVVDNGAQYYSSAGNSGNLNDGTSGVYEGNYVAGTLPPKLSSKGNSAHDFGGGNTLNTITADPPSFITLQWSDPVGGSGNDYDLYLLNPALDTVLAVGDDYQDGSADPYEEIDSILPDDTGNVLVIVDYDAPSARFLHLSTHRGGLAVATDGHTAGHAATEKAFGVAAVDQFLAGGAAFDGSETVEPFSSDGPRRIFYEPDGTPITPGDVLDTGGRLLMKPDIAAADGVSTSAPGFSTFFGTSAAAPHAAAIAAIQTSNPKPLLQNPNQAVKIHTLPKSTESQVTDAI